MTGFKKVFRDLVASRGRTAMMVLAMTTSMAGFGAITGVFGILAREMPASYLGTEPASATFDIEGGVSQDLLETIRNRPEVAAAVRRLSAIARYRPLKTDRFGRAKIFVIDDFSEMPIARVVSEEGAWPPPLGTVLFERSTLEFYAREIGDSFILRLPGGEGHRVTLSGIAYEPSLAPAITEQALYIYMTSETYSWLGGEPIFDELRVLMSEKATDAVAIEATSQILGRMMRDRGEEIHAIRIPPPMRHPHQTQMDTIIGMLVLFAFLTLCLSGVLTAALLQTMMARQIREIGVMKTIGASSRGVMALYVAMVGGLSLLGFLLALLPGIFGARFFAGAVGRLLNFDLASLEIPVWVLATNAAVCILLPLLIAWPTLRRGTRVSVHQALNDHDATVGEDGGLVSRIRMNNRLVAFALRNTLRQRRRFFLAVGLLAIAGGLFISSMSLTNSWRVLNARVFQANHYDVEFVFQRAEDENALRSTLMGMAGVVAVESWGSAPTAFANPGWIDVQHTYPDEGHGRLTLVAPEEGSSLVDFDVKEGRWLEAGDVDVVVVNQVVRGVSVGDEISLSVEGRAQRLLVVGRIEEVSGARVYTSSRTFANLAGSDSPTRLRVVIDSDDTAASISRVEHRLVEMGTSLEDSLPVAVVKNALAKHFEVLVSALLSLAVLLVLVGLLGLSASTSANVVERTREFGVLRAIGARPAQIRFVVWLEAVAIGAVSSIAAVGVAIPLSMAIGNFIGRMSFAVALPLALSTGAILAWTFSAIILSALAAMLPARAAGRLTVNEALAHV